MSMEEQFKSLQTEKAPPEDIKQEVFKTLDALLFMADVLDLFTVKYIATEAAILTTALPNENEEINNKNIEDLDKDELS